MLRFFKDSDLTRLVDPALPKWFFIPPEGGEKTTSLWIGDDYRAIVLAESPASSGALTLSNTADLDAAGTVIVAGQSIEYTSKTSTLISGIPASGAGSITVDIPAGASATQLKTYGAGGNLGFGSLSPLANVRVALKAPSESSFSVPTAPVILPFTATSPLSHLKCRLHMCDNGIVALDTSGAGKHGALYPEVAPPQLVAGVRAGTKGLYCNGTNQINVPPLALSDSNGTVEIWISPSNRDIGNILEIGSDLNISLAASGAMVAALGSTTLTEVPLPEIPWTHVVLTWGSGEVFLYVNGELVQSEAFSGPLAFSSDVVLGEGFTGTLDEFRAWARTFASDEIVTRYNYGSGVGMDAAFEPILRLDVEMQCLPGEPRLFEEISIHTLGSLIASAACSVWRQEQALATKLRVLSPGRKLDASWPGIVVGESRWREEDEISSEVLLPARWDPDIALVGEGRFVPGHAHGDDLKLVGLEKGVGGTIFPRIKPGHYFTGHNRYYLPSEPVLEFFPASSGASMTLDLSSEPAAQTPVSVGRWKMDQYGHYDTDINYRFLGNQFSAASTFDPESDELQCVVDRKAKQVRLNDHLPFETLFVGVGTANLSETYDLPVHPVERVFRVYTNDAVIDPVLEFYHNKGQGTLQVNLPTSGGVVWAGRALFADCEPAVAVCYDTGQVGNTRLLDRDLNPAFSGVPHGYLYLQHKIQKPKSLQLYADKPRVVVPPSFSGDPTLVGFGPVYYQNDYALLLATAYGSTDQEKVPYVRLKVEVDAGFQGLLNYQDPATDDIEIVTGADGSANLIFTPFSGYGQYLALSSSVSGTNVTLPVPVPISEIWNAVDYPYWKVNLYAVRNDDPYLGKAGANTDIGELPWKENGTPGTAAYTTNGRRVLVRDDAQKILYPVQALDVNGVNFDAIGFTGNVVTLVYPTDLPVSSIIGAFYVSYMGRVTLRVKTLDDKIISNSILLQMAAPAEIIDPSEYISLIPAFEGYLIPDDMYSGYLNKNRLAGGQQLEIQFSKRI